MSNSLRLSRKIRVDVVNMTSSGNSSHVASCLSISDILAVLYGDVLVKDPSTPRLATRDRFILSKGHAGAAVYAALAESGYFPTHELLNHYKNGSNLSGHVSHRSVPGVEVSTGSLGHGLGIACGIALHAQQTGKKHRIFCLLSDGELDEGSNWESFLFAAHFKLSNLIAIVDYNKLQSIGTTEETLALEPLIDKFRAFNLDVVEIDGHDHDSLRTALNISILTSVRPRVIICHTVKGKGISFMENNVLWHYRNAQGDEYESAMNELNTGK